jgi:hypothetical protein
MAVIEKDDLFDLRRGRLAAKTACDFAAGTDDVEREHTVIKLHGFCTG